MKASPIVRSKDRSEKTYSSEGVARLSAIIARRGKVPFQPGGMCRPAAATVQHV